MSPLDKLPVASPCFFRDDRSHLGRVSVPKGSFYHYFDSKEAFGLDLVERYGVSFARKLDRHLCNPALSPLSRLRAFVVDATDGMARFSACQGADFFAV